MSRGEEEIETFAEVRRYRRRRPWPRERLVAPQEEEGVRHWNGSLDNMEKSLERDYERGRR